MESKEHNYKILKIEKYNQEISNEKNNIKDSIVFLATATIFIMNCFTNYQQENVSELKNLFLLIGTMHSFLGVVWLQKLIAAVCKKTGLEKLIDEINNELENQEFEKKRGIRR